LSFAVGTNQGPMVAYLLSKGARLDAVDSLGNSVLHIAVLLELREMSVDGGFLFCFGLSENTHTHTHTHYCII
jgi:hypothetical protein